jgi:hydroxyacylglutathione hydrolase
MANTALVETRTSGLWQTNSTVLSSHGSVVVVDPAYFPRELDELATLVASRGRDVTVVFTHGHWDHVAGWRHFPGARVLGSPALVRAVAEGAPVAARNLGSLADFDGRWYVPRSGPAAWPPAVAPLEDRATLALGDSAVEALSLPGHSEDGLGLLVPSAGALMCGDYLSPCEIPFVEDLDAYRRTLVRMRTLLPRIERVIPGHGSVLDRAQAAAIIEEDLAYLDALASCAARGDLAAARALPLPRAADVPGMPDRHRENLEAAGLR